MKYLTLKHKLEYRKEQFERSGRFKQYALVLWWKLSDMFNK